MNMEKGTHGIDEKTFVELSYADQARSLNAQMLYLEKAFNSHLKRAQIDGKDSEESKKKYIVQLEKLIKGLK